MEFFPQDNADTQGNISLSEPIQSRDAIGAWAAYEKAKAKERQAESARRPQPQNKETFPSLENTSQSRDAIGAWAAYEKAKAKERQRATQAKPGEGKVGERNISLTESKGKSSDSIGARVGVSGRTYETTLGHFVGAALPAIKPTA